MENNLTHEIELYPLESFKTLLEYEVNRSRRYKDALTLIRIAVEADPQSAQTQHSAEVFAINILNLQLRETDIPCREGNEFLVLMPSTNEQGGRIACERLERLFKVTHQTYDRVSFQLSAFIGMASMPGDSSLQGSLLLHKASKALQHARSRKIADPIVYSDIA